MSVADTVERLAAARAEVAHVCECLLDPSPANLDRSTTFLEEAARHLAGGRHGLSEARRDCRALAEARLLRGAVERAGALLRSAFEYHARWNRILGVMSAGYTARGDAAPASRPGRVLVRG